MLFRRFRHRIVFVGGNRGSAFSCPELRIHQRRIVGQPVGCLCQQHQTQLVGAGEETDLCIGKVVHQGRHVTGFLMSLGKGAGIVAPHQQVVETVTFNAVQQQFRRPDVVPAAAVEIRNYITGDLMIQRLQFFGFLAGKPLQFVFIQQRALPEQLAAPLLVINRFSRRGTGLGRAHDGHKHINVGGMFFLLQGKQPFRPGLQHGRLDMMRPGIYQAAVNQRVGAGHNRHRFLRILFQPFQQLVRLSVPF